MTPPRETLHEESCQRFSVIVAKRQDEFQHVCICGATLRAEVAALREQVELVESARQHEAEECERLRAENARLTQERDEARVSCDAHKRNRDEESKRVADVFYDALQNCRAENARLAEQNTQMLAAINWACGTGDSDFAEPEHATRYWWRKPLHNKAGLEYNRETFTFTYAQATGRTDG